MQLLLTKARYRARLSKFISIIAVPLLGTVVVMASGSAHGQSGPKAFPSAEGFGAQAKGGRGGVVHHVTTLSDSGSGSLRACIEASGPRTCVFRVGGTITINSKLDVNNGQLTIAGQTAPGGGIQLRLSDSSKYRIMNINANDIIVRHVRFRRGATSRGAYSSGTCCGDTVQISGQRIVLDHVTLSFSTDENVEFYQASDVTIQHSIISYGLRFSTDKDTVSDPGQHHSMGAVVASGNNRISLRHNLFAFNLNRNPRLQSGLTDVCGNLVYGSSANPITLSGDASANVIGNVFDRRPLNNFNYVIKGGGAYASNNEASVPIFQSGTSSSGSPHSGSSCSYGPDKGRVLAGVGAQPRDSLDQLTINHVNSGSGSLIDSPSEVGGWPTLSGGTAYPDVDKDGMNDLWEAANSLSPGNSNDRNGDSDGDGYTNLEEFLNELANDSGTPTQDPPAEDPPAEDPPAEDPPAEDPPAEDPPAEDPPSEEPGGTCDVEGAAEIQAKIDRIKASRYYRDPPPWWLARRLRWYEQQLAALGC